VLQRAKAIAEDSRTSMVVVQACKDMPRPGMLAGSHSMIAKRACAERGNFDLMFGAARPNL
jgi:selenophosphate synthetase-related protein